MATSMEMSSSYGRHIASIREAEVPDLTQQVYLDSSGQPVVPRSVLNAVHERLISGPMISNPHSNSPSGQNTKKEIDEVRTYICREIFNVPRRGGRVETSDAVDPGWELVFTSGATDSLQNVARYFNFEGEGRFAYLEQSHSSLIGLRDLVTEERGTSGARGSDVLSEEEVVEWVIRQSRSKGRSLLALPLQCNATGRRYNKLVSSILKARETIENATSQRKVYIVLDAASYLSPSTRLPLLAESYRQPDFICFSFLKILGYPSGLGGLLLLRQSAPVILAGKRYYGGGTLEAVTSRRQWKRPSREVHEALEDGTQNLFGIIAVKSAMTTLRSEQLLGSWDAASDYVDSLSQHLWATLASLRHHDESPLVELYSAQCRSWAKQGPSDDVFHVPKHSQGPILLFNVLRSSSREEKRKERRVDPAEVDRLACVENIHLRSGRMCNVGAITQALHLCEEDIERLWERGIGCGSIPQHHCKGGFNQREDERLQELVHGCLRLSLSAWNTLSDVQQLSSFLEKYFRDEGDDESEYGSCDEGESDSESSCCGSGTVDSEDSSQATSDTSHSLHTNTPATGEASQHFLKDLHLYPIKSCAVQNLTGEWKLTPTGLEYDRQFCIVDIGSGKVMSQKQVPKMARIRPRICLVSQTLSISLVDENGSVETALCLPLPSSEGSISKPHVRSYDMCGKLLRPQLFLEDNIRAPLSAFLVRDCTLARFPAKTFYDDEDRVPLLFSNESPFLLISSESVQQVCRWIKEEHDRSMKESDVSLAFRPNLVISDRQGDAASFHEEDSLRVDIGPHTFAVMGPCRRCQMIALDQTTGLPATEILSVVAKHCRCQSGKLKGRLLFGLHLLWRPEWTRGGKDIIIKAGMPVRLH